MKRPAKGVCVRLAPSPTAALHLGSARLALLNWLVARRHNGHVLLRHDDADAARSPEGHAAAVEQDLRWLGLDWDETWAQHGRQDRYSEAAERLKLRGRLYPCLESEEELRFKRELRVKRGKSPVYDRAMLKLTPQQLEAAIAGGKQPYWRFRLSDSEVGWDDIVQGRTQVKLTAISDPIMLRADGSFLHAFTAAVDDMDAGITRIVRGADSVDATGVQLDLLSALGANPTAIGYAHVPLLHTGGGKARQLETLTLRRLRGDGVEPDVIAAYLLGGEQQPARPLGAVAEQFDLLRACAPAPFDVAGLQRLNRRTLGNLSFTEVQPRLPAGCTEAFWLAVRGSLDLLTEARGWWDVVAGTIVPPVLEEFAPLLRQALALLPPEPWPDRVWHDWLGAVVAQSGQDADGIAAALRLALTGEDEGPDLAALLPLMGRARAALRLGVAAA
jgi:glutamyl-tRNA synthetase